jgi:hypothetical protein
VRTEQRKPQSSPLRSDRDHNSLQNVYFYEGRKPILSKFAISTGAKRSGELCGSTESSRTCSSHANSLAHHFLRVVGTTKVCAVIQNMSFCNLHCAAPNALAGLMGLPDPSPRTAQADPYAILFDRLSNGCLTRQIVTTADRTNGSVFRVETSTERSVTLL